MRHGLWLVVLCGVAGGCAASGQAPSQGYQTVAKDPARDPERARVLNARAVEQIEKGRYEEAEKTLKEALGADVMFGAAHNNLGMVYYRQNRLYLAAWEFEYAAKLMPHQPEPRNNLGLVFEAAGKLDQAVLQYGEALKLEPDNPQFMGNAARARVRRGDKDGEVRDLLSKLVMRDSRPAWQNWARQNLALMGGRGEQ